MNGIRTGDSCIKAAITLLSEEMEELEVGEPLVIEYVSSLVSFILFGNSGIYNVICYFIC